MMPTTTTRPRIAVFRALALGDLLCAVPALRAIRAGNPGARISLIGLGRSREFVHRFRHLVDELVEFPGFPGIAEVEFRPAQLPRFLSFATAKPYDLAIDLHGDGSTSNAFVALLGARRTAGFIPPTGWQPGGEDFIPYPGTLHEIHRTLALVRHLGFPADDDRLELPLAPRDDESLRRSLGGTPLDTYVVVHPGASTPTRRWPAEEFAAVADTIASLGFRIVLTGSRGERAVTDAVARRMSAPAIDLAGATDLGALGALVARARLVVTNDTGVSHVTAAVGTPSVVLFTGSDRARWAPLDEDRHVAIGAGLPDGAGGRAWHGGDAGLRAGVRTIVPPPEAPRRADVIAAAVTALRAGDARVA